MTCRQDKGVESARGLLGEGRTSRVESTRTPSFRSRLSALALWSLLASTDLAAPI
jgi:hypothetical protein